MSFRLAEDQITFFEREGYITPLRAMSAEDAKAMRNHLESFERDTGLNAGQDLQLKAHAYFQWSYRLARSSPIVDVARSLLGDNIFCFASRFWIKEPGDQKHVSWHQDMAYFGMDPQAMITFWIALTPVTEENGAMRFIPRTHNALRSHDETHDPNNMLTRGQSVRNVDEDQALTATLQPGEFSVHHGNLLHNSPKNSTDDRRIGLALMLMPTHVKSTTYRRSVDLLCGHDEYGYWDIDPEPTQDRDPLIWDLMQKNYSTYTTTNIVQVAETAYR